MPPSDFQSVCEGLDPLQTNFSWRFVHRVKSKKVTKLRLKIRELSRELKAWKRRARTKRDGGDPCREPPGLVPQVELSDVEGDPPITGEGSRVSIPGGSPDLGRESSFPFSPVFGVTTRGGASTGEDPTPPPLTSKGRKPARAGEGSTRGGEGTKPHSAPSAGPPEGRKTVRWAENLEEVVGEGVDEAPSDSEEEDIVELTRPAAGEGAEGGT